MREYAASQNRLCGQPNSDKTKHLLFDLSILRLGGKELVTEMMTTLSQTVSVFSNKAINLKSVASFNTIKTLRFNPPSSPRSLSRKFCRVQATILQDEEEKVVVEESSPLKNFPNDDEPPETGSASALEKWVIKFEQSVNILLTESVIMVLDALYRDRDYARFFVLETIARVPYFAFISVLHMYESFGWWRRADYLKVHFAESWNEMHHLLIMEELGGNAWWFDRFLAQHIAVAYYFVTVFMYVISPRMAYHFSECVESHAFETYDKFIKAQGEKLKKMPAPAVAIKYYTGADLYLFENLYDVFLNIRDDEAEHCKTMKACQTHGNLRSPHSYSEDDFGCEDESGCIVAQADCEGIVDCIKKAVAVSTPRVKQN
ncbi:hypothetical protein WN943_012796 [Citrus x changshan-huyou]